MTAHVGWKIMRNDVSVDIDASAVGGLASGVH
jgi:hypothetical protein